MPPTRDAILHLPGEGGVEAALMRDLLAAAHEAHSGFIAFDRIVSDIRRWHREFPMPRRYLGATGLWYPDWDRPGLADSFVFGDELLLVGRVELRSPGFWEFVGALNPLEAIRKYLDDRHRRRQDREYREREDERELGLENDLREIGVVRERLNLAREFGVPEEDLAPLVQSLIAKPLGALGALQDRGVIDGSAAKIRRLPSGDS